MAKNKKSRGRVANDQPNARRMRPPEVYLPLDPIVVTAKRYRPHLRFAEDRREFHPSPDFHRPARNVFGDPRHYLVVGKKPRRSIRRSLALVRPRRASGVSGPTPRIAFAVPENVAICVRRKRRREVMFATRKNGKTGQRRPRRNAYSGVQC